jgi:hypothetical protein
MPIRQGEHAKLVTQMRYMFGRKCACGHAVSEATHILHGLVSNPDHIQRFQLEVVVVYPIFRIQEQPCNKT